MGYEDLLRDAALSTLSKLAIELHIFFNINIYMNLNLKHVLWPVFHMLKMDQHE